MKILLAFDDVAICPGYSDIPSRSEVDTSIELETSTPGFSFKLKLPIVSSPMDTVSESEMIFRLCKAGGLGILHRYCSIDYQQKLIKEAFSKWFEDETNHPLLFGGAIGVTGDFLERATMLVGDGAKLLCIDVAHGHHKNVVTALEALWSHLSLEKIHIMVGNVGPAEGFSYLAQTGLVNSIRCGLSGGSICSTYMATGVSYPTLQSVLDCSQETRKITKNVQICADGGIRHPGDICKALAAGADFVMLGSMLAGTKATPGERIIDKDGRECKQYRGGASYESQKARGIEKPRVEGVSALIPYKGKLENVIQPIIDGLQSGYSYVGARNLHEFRIYAKLMQLTTNSHVGGTPHILRGR